MKHQSYRLASRALANGAGERRSNFAGSGGEFLEHRRYEPGDELRFIDWNVYARSNKLFVRRFAAERATRIYAVMDQSASMQSKLEMAKSALAFIKPFARLDRYFERNIPDLSTGLTRLALEKPGLVMLFSDGLEPLTGIRAGLTALTARGFDVSWLQTLSPDDFDPPTGAWRIQDAEGNGSLEVDDSARRRYLQRFHSHLEGLAGLTRALGLRLARLDSALPTDIFTVLRKARMLERGA